MTVDNEIIDGETKYGPLFLGQGSEEFRHRLLLPEVFCVDGSAVKASRQKPRSLKIGNGGFLCWLWSNFCGTVSCLVKLHIRTRATGFGRCATSILTTASAAAFDWCSSKHRCCANQRCCGGRDGSSCCISKHVFKQFCRATLYIGPLNLSCNYPLVRMFSVQFNGCTVMYGKKVTGSEQTLRIAL